MLYFLYGNIECVAFPNVYDRIKECVASDKVVRLSGKMQLDDEKAPVIILDKMQEYEEGAELQQAGAAVEKKQKIREHALWLNASNLTEEEFDELVLMIDHYDNGNSIIKIKRGDKIYRLEGVNDCRGLREELLLFLRENEIAQV